MPLTYVQLFSTDMIVSEIEALLDWRHHILRHSFFPNTPMRPGDLSAPSNLLVWCRNESEKGAIDRRITERLEQIYNELCHTAQNVLEGVAKGTPLTLSLYDRFENQFEGYVTQLRRLHEDVSDLAVAIDPVTGLRTASGMKGDLQREQNRFDRKGTAFSIAAVSVDKKEHLQRNHDRKTIDVIYGTLAQIIARTLRSFDDVYYMGSGEFVIVVKHIEFMDACAVMDRLRHDIETAQIYLPSGDKAQVTASFGICEALQKETPETALESASAAMREASAQGGNRVQEFIEMSALEQFTKDIPKK
jgi:diguanylate cyclase (GGDEF)-like protein